MTLNIFAVHAFNYQVFSLHREPLHERCRTWEHCEPTVAWSDQSNRSCRLYTFLQFYHLILVKQFRVPLWDTW